MLTDIHNHTAWSDGDNCIEDLISRAAKYKLNKIGISDHYEMLPNIDIYINGIEEVRKKYENLIVLKGVEIKITTLLSLSDNKLSKLSSLDYILIEYIEYQNDIVSIIEQLAPILEVLQCSVGLAHMDLSRLGRFRKPMLDFMKKHDIFLDFNIDSPFYNDVLDGIEDISDVANAQIVVLVGSDSHSIEQDWFNTLLRGKMVKQNCNTIVGIIYVFWGISPQTPVD